MCHVMFADIPGYMSLAFQATARKQPVNRFGQLGKSVDPHYYLLPKAQDSWSRSGGVLGVRVAQSAARIWDNEPQECILAQIHTVVKGFATVLMKNE